LLAMAVCQSIELLNVLPSSPASRLLQGVVVCTLFVNCADNCRSEPARDSGLSVNMAVECAAVIASKPAPTGSGGVHTLCELRGQL